MKTTLLSLTIAAWSVLAAVPSALAQQANEAEPVTQVIIEQNILSFSQPIRLLNLYQAAELAPNAYWPSSRLVSAEQNKKLNQRRSYVLGQLSELEQSAIIEGDDALAQAAAAYAEQLPSWPLIGAERVGLTKVDDRLEVQSGVKVERPSLYSTFNDAAANLQANPQLPSGTLQLLPPKNLGAWQVTVVSPLGVQRVPFNSDDTVRGILKDAGVFAADYDVAEVTLISLTGLSTRTTVAYYNDAKAMPPVHGIIFVDLDVSAMDAKWQRINAQLGALLSYWNPQS